MKSLIDTIYLIISSLTLIAVGAFISLSPAEYITSLDGSVKPSINVLSDLRGMGGMILVPGVFMFASLFRKSLLPSALVLSTIIYTVFVVFRSIGFVLDGLPQTGLMVAYGIEIALAFIGALMLRIESIKKYL